MISETELMAYLDGELPLDRKGVVEEALGRDPALRKLLEDELLVRQAVGGFYAPVLDEQVPQRLLESFNSASNVIPMFNRAAPELTTSRKGFTHWERALPLAASLVLGLFAGLLIPSRDTISADPAVLRAEVVAALDSQLVAEQDPNGPVTIGLTFARQDGSLCRTYTTSEATGLACREGEEWRLALLAPSVPVREREFQQASSSASMIMGSVQDMISGEPMSTEQEREARNGGWVRKMSGDAM
jgi:hypothetical protein